MYKSSFSFCYFNYKLYVISFHNKINLNLHLINKNHYFSRHICNFKEISNKNEIDFIDSYVIKSEISIENDLVRIEGI